MIDLKEELFHLQQKLRDETMEKYKRVNPFVEDITDWKEKDVSTCSVKGRILLYTILVLLLVM